MLLCYAYTTLNVREEDEKTYVILTVNVGCRSVPAVLRAHREDYVI